MEPKICPCNVQKWYGETERQSPDYYNCDGTTTTIENSSLLCFAVLRPRRTCVWTALQKWRMFGFVSSRVSKSRANDSSTNCRLRKSWTLKWARCSWSFLPPRRRCKRLSELVLIVLAIVLAVLAHEGRTKKTIVVTIAIASASKIKITSRITSTVHHNSISIARTVAVECNLIQQEEHFIVQSLGVVFVCGCGYSCDPLTAFVLVLVLLRHVPNSSSGTYCSK